MALPVNIDSTYSDRSAGDALHQQHHDTIHQAVNDLAATYVKRSFAPAADDRIHLTTDASWSAGRALSLDGTKDGLIFIDGFVDASGVASPVSYTKLAGFAGVSKTGAGNLDAFWASVTHSGAGEVGLFIGDVTAAAGGSGGNIWGGHVRLTADVAASMRGMHIDMIPNVDVSAKTTIALDVSNANATNAISQGLRVRGNFTNPLIIYSDAAGTAITFDLDLSGNQRLAGNITPLVNGTKDLGQSALRWRLLHVNNIQINGGDSAAGAGNLAIKDTATAPANTPVAGGVLYSEAGAGKWKGSSGTITTFGTAEPHCPDCGRDFALEWESDRYGYLALCMWCAAEGLTKGVMARRAA